MWVDIPRQRPLGYSVLEQIVCRQPLATNVYCITAHPSTSLPALATGIRQHLNDQYRCLYLHSPAMVAEMRSLLLIGGTDVTQLVTQGRLVLSSESDHLLDGRFHIDRMMTMLKNAVNDALKEGYRGLFAPGDMTWEFGPDKDFSKLVEYEWQLEDLFREQPALSGICQYHIDTLPAEVLRQGFVTHSSLYLNATLSRLNPLLCQARILPRSTSQCSCTRRGNQRSVQDA